VHLNALVGQAIARADSICVVGSSLNIFEDLNDFSCQGVVRASGWRADAHSGSLMVVSTDEVGVVRPRCSSSSSTTPPNTGFT
jgi:hypothetical protein